MANGDIQPAGDGTRLPDEGARAENTSTIDSTFDILADPLRRALVRTLAERSDEVLPEALAAELANRSHTSVDRDRIAVRLIHIDLPKLADEDLIEWDPHGPVQSTKQCTALAAAVDAFFRKYRPE